MNDIFHMLYFVYGHKCLILVLVHSVMGMITMMHSCENHCSNSKYICLLLGFNNGIEKLNSKDLYLDF